MNKLSDEEIHCRERENRHPRVSLLEQALSAELLDERYLANKVPGYRKFFYKYLPIVITQIIEAFIIHRRYKVIFSQSEKVGLPLAYFLKIIRSKIPQVMIVSRITSMDDKKSKQKKWFIKQTKDTISRFLIWSSVQRNIAINELGVEPSKLVLIKRGTDQKFWKPEAGSESGTDTICSVGMEMRDYPTLIEALRPLNIPCHIATGEARGELFETVRRLHDMQNIPGHITIGRKPYLELRALYARSRFVVVPLLNTDSDNGLTSILEAMAMGKTVICSRVEGQIDIIQEGITGLYVPQGDPIAMRNAIVKLWNDPVKAEQMGMKARTFVEETHNFEQFVDCIKKEVLDAVKETKADNYRIFKKVEAEA